MNCLKNTATCRRRLLFKYFLMYSDKGITVYGCSCCDVCETSVDDVQLVQIKSGFFHLMHNILESN